MAWFRVDDDWWSHPKTLSLSDSAQALWLRAGSWSMKHLTDGQIPTKSLRILNAKPKNIRELIDAGFWQKSGDGYSFHDWHKYQPTRSSVLESREKTAARVAAYRERKRAEKQDGNGERNGVTNGVGTPAPTPTPTPTVKKTTNVVQKSEQTTAEKSRGSRLPQNWMPTPETITNMQTQYPDVDYRLEHQRFTDHWLAQPGSKGVKKDWDATWRNWIRKADEYRRESERRSGGKQTQLDGMSAALDFAQKLSTQKTRQPELTLIDTTERKEINP